MSAGAQATGDLFGELPALQSCTPWNRNEPVVPASRPVEAVTGPVASNAPVVWFNVPTKLVVSVPTPNRAVKRSRP